MKKIVTFWILAAALSLALAALQTPKLPPLVAFKATATRTVTRTPTVTYTPTLTATPTLTITPSETPTEGETPTPTDTLAETQTPALTPYPAAPACTVILPEQNHNTNTFHTLWNGFLGCHYDHEHGQYPFVESVVNTFPDFDLSYLLCDVEIGHCNPSSEMENTHKHGGFKWQVSVPNPSECVAFEGSAYCVDAAVIQYHAFGDYSIEFEARVHSALALIKECDITNPFECGYIYTAQHVDYGQRVIPYQGTVMTYPDTPNPAYLSPLAPYFTLDCVGAVTQCRSSIAFVVSHKANVASIWTSKSAFRIAPSGSNLLAILFRVRDAYQLFDWTDQTYPFTFKWVCTADDGLTYNPTGCKYNNSTTTVHEVTGVIPGSWDGLVGFDTDSRLGRVTGDGYTTRFGELNLLCTAPGLDCHPLRLVGAFVGKYGSELTPEKASFSIPAHLPERDIYFCGVVVCSETDAGAVPSGWIGAEN